MNGKIPLSFLFLSITPKDGIIQKIEQQDIGKFRVTYQPDVDAYYPSFSKRAGEQGKVVVRLIIDETGIVEDISLLQSSTFPRLDRAGIEIGKRYQFTPFIVNGAPQRISTNIQINFKLKDINNSGANTPEKFLEILAKDSNNVTALNALGYYYADRNERLTEAFELINKAHQLSPKDANILDSLGWVNYRLGNNAVALHQLQNSFSMAQKAETAAHLGEVLWKLGRFKEAEDTWRQGEKIDSSDKVLQEIQKRLKDIK